MRITSNRYENQPSSAHDYVLLMITWCVNVANAVEKTLVTLVKMNCRFHSYMPVCPRGVKRWTYNHHHQCVYYATAAHANGLDCDLSISAAEGKVFLLRCVQVDARAGCHSASLEFGRNASQEYCTTCKSFSFRTTFIHRLKILHALSIIHTPARPGCDLGQHDAAHNKALRTNHHTFAENIFFRPMKQIPITVVVSSLPLASATSLALCTARMLLSCHTSSRTTGHALRIQSATMCLQAFSV